MTTVGYGDKTPKGVVGRLLAMGWMFASVFLVAHFTATLTSHATLQELHGTIRSIDDLADKRIITVHGSTAERYLLRKGMAYAPTLDIRTAYHLLETQQADAVVYDAPVLQHYALTAGKGKVQPVGPIFSQEPYGIALQPQAPIGRRSIASYLRWSKTARISSSIRAGLGVEPRNGVPPSHTSDMSLTKP